MHLSEAAIRALPQLGVTHRPQEVVDLLLLVLRVGLNLQAVDLLQNFRFLVQEKLQGKLLLLLTKFG